MLHVVNYWGFPVLICLLIRFDCSSYTLSVVSFVVLHTALLRFINFMYLILTLDSIESPHMDHKMVDTSSAFDMMLKHFSHVRS